MQQLDRSETNKMFEETYHRVPVWAVLVFTKYDHFKGYKNISMYISVKIIKFK